MGQTEAARLAPPPPSIKSDAALAGAILALARIDPGVVARLTEGGRRPALRLRPAGFEGLARIVVAQQVSTAIAAAIASRLALVLTPFEPAVLAATSDEALRDAACRGRRRRPCGPSRPRCSTARWRSTVWPARRPGRRSKRSSPSRGSAPGRPKCSCCPASAMAASPGRRRLSPLGLLPGGQTAGGDAAVLTAARPPQDPA